GWFIEFRSWQGVLPLQVPLALQIASHSVVSLGLGHGGWCRQRHPGCQQSHEGTSCPSHDVFSSGRELGPSRAEPHAPDGTARLNVTTLAVMHLTGTGGRSPGCIAGNRARRRRWSPLVPIRTPSPGAAV